MESKYPQGTDCNSMRNDIDALEGQLDAAIDELDYTSKGLQEWRSVALEALSALSNVVALLELKDTPEALKVAVDTIKKYPTT